MKSHQLRADRRDKLTRRRPLQQGWLLLRRRQRLRIVAKHSWRDLSYRIDQRCVTAANDGPGCLSQWPLVQVAGHHSRVNIQQNDTAFGAKVETDGFWIGGRLLTKEQPFLALGFCQRFSG